LKYTGPYSVVRRAALLLILLAMTSGQAAALAQSASSNYALPASAINAGMAAMASSSYRLSSSIGDAAVTAPGSSAAYVLMPGFWHAVIGVRDGCVLDVDGDQTVGALTDGLILLRVMLGLTGDSVVAGATGPTAPRTTWSQLQPFVHLPALDLDGDGATSPATDGVMLLRAMFGLTGNAVTSGALVGTRTWSEIRSYFNTRCGGAFAL
jgi:hypothetical protein